MAYDRIQRINELLREQLAGALYRVGSGEDVDRVAISFFSAEVSRDLRDATVQVSFLGDDPAKHAALLSWLRRHRADFQRAVADGLRLKYTPRIQFRQTSAPAKAYTVLEILSRLPDPAPDDGGDADGSNGPLNAES